MTLRDLTDEQTDELIQKAETLLKSRQTARESNTINSVDYKLAFSDGVKAVLEPLEHWP